MNEAGSREPDADQRGHELAEAYAVGRFQDVEVLKHVRNRHQSQSSREPQTCTTHNDTANAISSFESSRRISCNVHLFRES